MGTGGQGGFLPKALVDFGIKFHTCPSKSKYFFELISFSPQSLQVLN